MLKEKCQKIADKICKERGIPSVPIKFSKALKSANGRIYYEYDRNKFRAATTPVEVSNSLTKVYISISALILDHFSEKEVIETLHHEVAHWIRLVEHKEDGHSLGFKKLCVELGGTMNKHLAGTSFSASACNTWVSSVVKYKLQCSCGAGYAWYTKAPKQSSLDKYHCPKCKEKLRHWKKVDK